MKEKKIQFREKRIPLFTPTTNDELQQYYSDSKVPVLLDNDLVIWDSLAILEHLSEKHLSSKGWPEDEKARAMARSVSAEMHSSFFSIRNNLPMNCRKENQKVSISNDTKQEILRVESLWENCFSSYGGSGGWLFGDYSIADAMFSPLVIRFHGYGINLGETAKRYSQKVLEQNHIIEWMKDGRSENEVIAEAEI